MRIRIVLNKLRDRDLILLSYRYNISEIFKIAITAIAYGKNIKLISNESYRETKEELHSQRISFTINDPIVSAFLKQLNSGYRSTYCKIVVRQALSGLYLESFFCSPMATKNLSLLSDEKEHICIDSLELKSKSNASMNTSNKSNVSDVFISAFNSINDLRGGY